jgi:hypothetical protein
MLDTSPHLDDLLNRKRGAYGPWGLFHLDSGQWAVVWEECLDDEGACQLILYESSSWFNAEPGRDGRRPNPTYATQQDALVEIIRLLPYAEVDAESAASSALQTYLAWAHADLLKPLLAWQMSASYPHDLTPAAPETATPPTAPVGPFPWDTAIGEPKGVSPKFSPVLYAKMKWLCDNVPRMSMLRITRDGAEAEANRLVALYYKKT